MPDSAERAVEREYAALKRKVTSVYKQAYKEVADKGKEYTKKHEARAKKYSQMVKDGKMSKADYDAWMQGQVFQGKQWEAKKKQMQDSLYHADLTAQKMIDDSRYRVFAEGANYTTRKIKSDTGIGASFRLYDEQTVKRLVKDKPELLPPGKVGKDKAYKWYSKRIQSSITQGILQGEDITQIAQRIGRQTGQSELSTTLRHARTAFTGAQCAGRMEGLHEAQKMGIRVQKQWLATKDSRTRDAHIDLDGQIVDVDEPFESELGPIMYPGDPDADPANVWNCRCTLTYVYPDY